MTDTPPSREARRRFFFLRSNARASKLGKLIELASSPAAKKAIATAAGSAGYIALGQAGYQPGTATSAGMDAEQVRMIFAAVFALAGYVIPSGTLGVIRNWANILGKESAGRIDKLEARVAVIESGKLTATAPAAKPSPAKDAA